MAFSFMNGMSGLGAGLQEAGLQAQKGELLRQQMMLADQLATTREKEVTQPFQASQATQQQAAEKERTGMMNQTALQTTGMSTASAEKVAGIQGSTAMAVEGARAASAEHIAQMSIAAQAPFVAANVAEIKAKTDLSSLQTQQLTKSLDLNTKLADEMGKPEPDTKTVQTLQNQVAALAYDPKVSAAVLSAADNMATTSQAAVSTLMAREATLITQLNTPEIEPGAKETTKQALADVQTQIKIAQGRASHFADMAGRRLDQATNTPPQRQPPPLPAGVPGGSRYNFDHEVFQAPDGRLFDKMGNPAGGGSPALQQTQKPPAGLINGAVASP